MNFAAGVTLYNPSNEQISRIIEYSKSFKYVILFDNTDNLQNRYVFPSNFVYFSEGKNMGLPYAFNHIIDFCLNNNIDFLCTLDQDSIYTFDDICNMKSFIENKLDVEKVGVIGPFIDYGKNDSKNTNEVVFRKWVITSGAFINVKIIKKENIRYDLNYFIDKFEIDLCQQFISKKYDVIMYYGATLHQRLGELNYKGHSEHNAIRHYYIFRNRYYFNKKWRSPLMRVIYNFLQTQRHLYRILKFETGFKEKKKMLKIARKDHRCGKYGKYDH